MIDSRSMRSLTSVALLALAGLALTGCGIFGGVTVAPVATSFQRPSNVAAYVAVTDGDTPLTELSPSNFRVYENGQLVPSEQAQLTLLDRNQVVAHHALLLVDMSQAQKPEARALAARAALAFANTVSPHEAVSVFAFDGSESLVQIASVPRGSSPTSMAALENFTPRDPSRNLNGAVVAALGKLDAALAQSGKQVKVGTLVVFASGPDAAGRVDGDQLHQKLWASQHDIIAIGIAQQDDGLESLGRRGLVRAQGADTLPIAFEEAAQKARSELEKYYLVSYCSPSRAGERRLRLEVTYTDKEGTEHSGDFESDFDARGFGPGCNSESTPRLVAIPKDAPPKETTSTGGSSTQPAKSTPPDSREHDQGEDAPVPPPEQSGYAK